MLKQYCVIQTFGCNLDQTKTRYAVFFGDEYKEVLALLTPYRSRTDDEVDAKLKEAGICVYGGNLLQKFIDEISDPSFFNYLCDELEAMLQEENNAEKFAQKVSFMKDNKFFPDRKWIDQLFNAAVKKTNSLPPGEAKDLLTAACKDLREILRYVFTH
jgi:hypothetical protein